MMAALSYYLIIYPLSLLPLKFLYFFSDVFYLLNIHVYPYRHKVVRKNLRNSFPDLTEKELKIIERKFYRHFSDLLAESIKNLAISKKELQNRFVIKNPEVMDHLFNQNKSVVLVSGHYNNWEWLITSQSFHFPHKAMGIGMPLSSKFFDKKMNQRRQRFGMQVIHSKNFKEEIKKQAQPVAILTLGDQSPADSLKSYWMNFLNQETAVLFGTEQMAHAFHFSVVFFVINKQKRGFYEMTLHLITDDPKTLSWGEITETHTKLLENEIVKHPEFWLWSHKRWKRKVPEHLDVLRKEQESKFNQKFKKPTF